MRRAVILVLVVCSFMVSAAAWASVTHEQELHEGGTFVARSVSFTSTEGLNVSRRGPTGTDWDVRTLRAENCERSSRSGEFVLVDPDGITYASLSAGTTPDTLAWEGTLLVPDGWTVGIRWQDMHGDSTGCNWQLTGVVRTAPAPTDVA